MNPAGLRFPASRAVAELWRQLAPRQPTALWVGHLFLHHVEAGVVFRHVDPLDPLQKVVLERLVAHGPLDAGTIADQLGVGRPLAYRLAQRLQTLELIEHDEARRYQINSQGRQALAAGSRERIRFQRATFHFVQLAGAAPRYLWLRGEHGLPFVPEPGWSLQPRVLTGCLSRSWEWKERQRFPAEFSAVLPFRPAAGESTETATLEPRQRVVIDRPEHLAVALALVPGGEGANTCHGFALHQETWQLLDTESLFELDYPLAAMEALGKLLEEPNLETWRAAWRSWCRGHGIVSPELDACRLVRQGFALQAAAPVALVDRLKSAAGGDPSGEETWLLAGEGPTRCAARLEITSAG